MWMVTEQEAIEIFARHFVARHRAGAPPRARQKAESLKDQGDLQGHKVWNQVADTAERLRSERRRAAG